MSDKIEAILNERRKQEAEQPEETKFFQVLRVEGAVEHYLEFRFRQGIQTAFRYDDLAWFNYDPQTGELDLEFMGCVVTITGRGFSPDLFQAIKSRRLSWIREADTEMQDHESFPLYVREITIVPPADFGAEEES